MQGNINFLGQTIMEVFKDKNTKQNHNSFHKVCLDIVIIHYIFSNLNLFFF